MKKLSLQKWCSVFACVLLLAGLLTACGAPAQPEEPSAEAITVNITALKGPTAMGMVQLMNQADDGEFSDAEYRFNIASSIDEVTPALAKGETDIAAVPANVASVLYNRTKGGIEVLAINTLGVLYIVENGDTVHSVENLRGRTIYASGKGATPEYALNYILTENGIDPMNDVTIEWKSEHADCVAALAEGAGAVGIAAAMYHKVNTEGKTVCALLSGGNVDVTMLERILTRGLAKEGRTVSFSTVLPDQPHALASFLEVVSSMGANVLDVNHERRNTKAAIGSCVVNLSVETRDKAHIQELFGCLRRKGYVVEEQ